MLSDRVTLSVDAMGGDFGPRVTLLASLSVLSRFPFLYISLIGDLAELNALLKKQSIAPSLLSRLELVSSGVSVSMEEKPSFAIRHRQDSSMCLAIKQVADKQSDACVSAGNTGALMAFGRMILKTLPGIERPAIISAVPTDKGHSYVLDLGANVDCSAQQLLQFAVMGSVIAETVFDKQAPSVGLLNIGEEVIKGNEQVRLANDLIRQQSGLNYIGYVEGSDLFSGKADIIVCDGFVGNVVLKSSEGLARFIAGNVKRSFTKSLYRKLLAVLAKPVLSELQFQLDPSRRNGATFLGLQGIVIKSHGSANQVCFEHAIEQAISEVQQNVPAKIGARLRELLAVSDD